MRDLLNEIAGSLRRNKLRTALTGFAVAWGIFMIIALLGAGNGLLNALLNNDSDNLATTITVWGQSTSKPYGGYDEGRRIVLDGQDVRLTENEAFADVVDDVTAVINRNDRLSLGKESVSASIVGIYPEYCSMGKVQVQYGRVINDVDMREKRKFIVIPGNLAETLLGKEGHNEEIIGKVVRASDVLFTVVGVTKTDRSSNNNNCYAPFSTVRTVYGMGNEIDNLVFSFHGLPDEESNRNFESVYRRALNTIHKADPTDMKTFYIRNSFLGNIQMHKAIRIIRIALWIIGLFTLLSGVVGVSNIMLITVKERTHEFGIRKAIGAKPGSILKLIISESVAITAAFGYIGMILGLAACELMDKTLARNTLSVMDFELNIFKDPFVGVDVAVEATLVLIIAGIIAGLVPASKASRVRPIEALREG